MHAASLPLWFAALSESAEVMYQGSIQTSEAEVQELQSLRKFLVQLVISALKVLVQLKSAAADAAISHCYTFLSFLTLEIQPALYKATATQLLSTGRPLSTCIKTTLAIFHVMIQVMMHQDKTSSTPFRQWQPA